MPPPDQPAWLFETRAVDQVERGAITVIDTAAALPEVPGIGRHGVLGDDYMIQRERAIVENAACKLRSHSHL